MSQIPHLLTPYLSLPRDSGSLTLLTSVLGASTNWLILRYLQSYLRPSPSTSPGDEPEIRVLLISFLRDAGFWREGARKLVCAPPSPPKPHIAIKVQGID